MGRAEQGETMEGVEEIDILTGLRKLKGKGQAVVDSIWGGSYASE